MKRTLFDATKARVRLTSLSILLLMSLAIPAVSQTPTREKADAGKPQRTRAVAQHAKAEKLEVIHRRGQTILAPTPIEQITIDNPKFVDVIKKSAKEIELIGLELGSTQLALSRKGHQEPIVYQVQVIPGTAIDDGIRQDFSKLEKQLNLLFPNAKVYLVPLQNRLIVKGQASSDDTAEHILRIVQSAAENSPLKQRFQKNRKPDEKKMVVSMLEIKDGKTAGLNPNEVPPLDLASYDRLKADHSPYATAPYATAAFPDPATASQQVRLAIAVATAPDDVVVEWGIKHKSQLRKVERYGTPGRLSPAVPRPLHKEPETLASLVGSAVPVPFLFNSEVRKDLFERLESDTRANLLLSPQLIASWYRKATIAIGPDRNGQKPFGLEITATPIGKGELGLQIEAEVPKGLKLPAPTASWNWSLRARANHTILIPVTKLNSKERLVLLVEPKLVPAPPVALAANPQPALPRGPYAAQPRTRAPLHPIQPAPAPPLYATADELVQITANVVIAKPQFIPEKPVELDRKQLDASMKEVKADSATINHQLQTNVRYGEQAHLSPPYPQGHKQPFELRITPKKVEDSITLDLQAEIKALWPGNSSATDVHLKITTEANKTTVVPLPIQHPDGRKVAILLQPSPMPIAVPVRRPVAEYATPATPKSVKTVALFQMLLLDVDSKIVTKVIGDTKTSEEKLKEIEVQKPRKNESKKRGSKQQTTRQRTFLLNGTASKLFVAELRKQDESFRVLSRPQVRTMLDTAAALSIHGGPSPSEPKKGLGKIDIHVTPRKSGEDFVADTMLKLTGPGSSSKTEWSPGLSVTASAKQKCGPGRTAVMVIGENDSDRAILLLTDLVHVDTVAIEPSGTLASGTPVPRAGVPAWKKADENTATLKGHTYRGVATQRSRTTSMRLVTVEAVTGTGVSKGDTVDVLLVSNEDGTAESAKIETLCESVTVSETARASLGNTTSVTLLVEKALVEKLLLAQLKGTLRLSVHRSTVQNSAAKPLPPIGPYSWPTYPPAYTPVTEFRAQPYRTQAQPVYQAQPVTTYQPVQPGTRVIYDSGEWKIQPPKPVVPASGTQKPTRPVPATPAKPAQKPKSEVQQVLDEVREMRKLIQGLREDMNALRKSVGVSSRRKPADVWLPIGQHQSVTRKKKITRVDGFDPKILDVHALKPDTVSLLGKSTGRTTVKFELEDGETQEISVIVVVAETPGTLPGNPVPRAADFEPVLEGNAKKPTLLKPVARPRGPHTDVRVAVHHGHRIRSDKKFTRIAVAAPKIADIVQYSPYEAEIIGKQAGSTNIRVWFDGEDEPKTFEVLVVAPEKPLSTTGSEKTDTARRQIEQALSKEVSLEIDDGSLKDALRLLSKSAGVNVTIDSAALDEEGISADTKVSVHLSGVSLRSTLKILLSPLGLATLIEDEVLKVTSKTKAKGQQILIAYQVAGLVPQTKDGKPDFDELISLVTTVVEPDSWEEVGGPGSIAASAPTNALVILQSQAAHEEIQQLFSALRKWRDVKEAPLKGEGEDSEARLPKTGLQKLRDEAASKRSQNRGIPHLGDIPDLRKNDHLLRRKVSLHVEKQPLQSTLAHIATSSDLQLAIDKAGLAEEGVTEKTPVTITVDGVMTQSALNLILEPLKLAYVLEDGKVLRVSSQTRLRAPTVRVYQVKTVIADPEVLDLKALSTLIQDTVQPDSWQKVGGQGSIATNEKTKSLVIRQSKEAQDEISRLLKDLSDLAVASEEATRATSTTRGDSKEKSALESSPIIGVPIDIPRRKSNR